MVQLCIDVVFSVVEPPAFCMKVKFGSGFYIIEVACV